MTCALALLLLAPLPAVNPGAIDLKVSSINDRAGLFSPQAREEADRKIAEIRRDFDIGLNIETVKELPDYTPAALRKMNNRQRNELLRDTAWKRADEANANGLFILIINEPRHVTVVGWPRTREGQISSTKRKSLQRYLAGDLARDPDHALIATCDLFRDMVKNLQARAPTPLSLPLALILMGSLIGGWIVLRLLRGRVVAPALPIYQPAMFGSLFGVPAGYWINDRLFHAERPVAPASAAVLAPSTLADVPLVEATGDDPAPPQSTPESDPYRPGEHP